MRVAGKRPDSSLSRPQLPSNPLTNRLPSHPTKDNKNKLILLRSSLELPTEATYSILSTKEAVKENKCNNNPLLDESMMQPRYEEVPVVDTTSSVT